MAFETPELGYEYDALEPHISKEIMEVHYGKHHKGYTTKLNAAVEKHPELFDKTPEWLITNLDKVPGDIRMAVKNTGGGHVNHAFFWSVLKKDVAASGPVVDAIVAKWGSLEAFQEDFSAKAASVFGSGWTWLVKDTNGALAIVNTPNQETPLADGKIPLLVIDVWEHAYYLQYKQDRPGFIKAFWNIVNWEQVNKNFEA